MGSFPRSFIALVSVVAMIGILYLGDPPKNRCSWQRNEFLAQNERLFVSYGFRVKRSPKLVLSMASCREANSVGGCRQFFELLNQLNFQMRDIPTDCSEYFAELSDLISVNWRAVQLISELSWGAFGPQSAVQRQGWLGASEISTFCELKKNQIKLVGEDVWNNHVNGMIRSLPDVKKLADKEAWLRSIFSYKCQI